MRSGGVPLQRGEVLQPFFIIGPGRSGTTLLRRLLIADPTVHVPPETYVLGRALKDFQALARAPWSTLVNATLARFEYHPEFVRFGISLRDLANELYDMPEDRRSLARVIDRMYHFHAEATLGHEVSLWGDKTPRNTMHLPAIRSVFPDARFVHLVRDGYDVVESLLRIGREPDVHAAARRWVEYTRRAQAFGKSVTDQYREVRYERLVTDPEGQLRALCPFLGITFDPGMLNSQWLAEGMGDVPALAHHRGVSEPVSDQHVGRGRTHLASADAKFADRIMGSQMRLLGYESPEAGPARKDREVDFDARDFWEKRLEGGTGVEAVGNRRFGLRYNEALYDVRRQVIGRCLSRHLGGRDVQGLRVLDVGSGSGFYVDLWQRLGVRELQGLDITDGAVAHLRIQFPGLTFTRADIGDEAFQPTGKFDVVSAFDVLFHIVDDVRFKRALANIAGCLVDDGLFVWTDLFLRDRSFRKEHQSGRGLDDQLRALDAAGFDVVERRPVFVLMEAPVDTRNRVAKLWWRGLRTAAGHSEVTGRVIGRALAPIDMLLSRHIREGPSIEVMVCSKRGTPGRR